jgi:1-deoxy-D-xylulose-5-phosphate reductoisomerase
MNIKRVTILGSTGTIGVQTLDVISRHPLDYEVYALTGHKNIELLTQQCQQFSPKYAVLLDELHARQLEDKIKSLGIKTQVLFGIRALETVASEPEVDIVMAAIVGAAGLMPAIAAAKAGKRILLANKETLVMSGSLFMKAVEEGGATLLPIDSEHNAIFQVMPTEKRLGLKALGIRKILLTASGGPFRNKSLDALRSVTLEEALNHPNWVMGPKITIDSATMMNKGLEVIEAFWLFNAMPHQIEVVVHPQSVIHSMVEYIDGSVLAQLGNPDMRTPIAYALAYPHRLESGVSSLDLFKTARLDFESPDPHRFPCLRLAYDSLNTGGTAPAVLNAANEVAVNAFIQKMIGFNHIPQVIEEVLQSHHTRSISDLDELIEIDQQARYHAFEQVEMLKA